MRIAICISGFLRTWADTKRSFMEHVTHDSHKHTYDIFIHTYSQNMYEFTAGLKDVNLTSDDFKNAFGELNVKKIVIEDRVSMLPEIFKESARFRGLSNYNLTQKESSDPESADVPIGVRIYDQLRKVNECNKLRQSYEKENNMKYDLVVKTRFDLLYLTKIKWESCNDGKVHLDFGATWGYPPDTFCCCTPTVMDTSYANRIELFDELYLYDDGSVKKEMGICAHFTLRSILTRNNIEIGDPAVNILCYRNENQTQYNGNYRFKYNIHDLYRKIKEYGVHNVFIVENIKRVVMIDDKKE